MPAGRAARFGFQSPTEGEPRAFTRPEKTLPLVVIGLALALVVWLAVVSPPPSSRQIDVFGGSVVLPVANEDPVVVDLATGLPTLKLTGLYKSVGGATFSTPLGFVALTDGTLVYDPATGVVNYLAPDNLVVDRAGGVGLGATTGLQTQAVDDGTNAYVVRSGNGHSTVYLVSRSVVALGNTRTGAAKVPVPATVTAGIDGGGGEAVSANGDLWLVTGGASTRLVEVVPSTDDKSLRWASLGSVPGGSVLGATVAPGGGDPFVALASSSSIRVFTEGASTQNPTPGGPTAGRIVPVSNCTGTAWFAFPNGNSWRLVGATKTRFGSSVKSMAVKGITTDQLISPVCDHGAIYAMADQGSRAQPRLLKIDLTSGVAGPIPGNGVKAPSVYPANKNDVPGLTYTGEQVLADGPRVVFNNPASQDAVTLFTDGSEPTVVFDKASAVNFNPTAPPGGGKAGKKTSSQSTNHVVNAPPPVQVDNKVNCSAAGLQQSPRTPSITGTTPGPHSILVQWSYTTLTSEDCYPQTWEVTVTPVDGSPPPAQPTSVVQDANQYLVSGLASNSTYQVTVTAFIGSQFATSTPSKVQTSSAGPDPPTSVTTSANGQGWVLNWKTCASGCPNPIPVESWLVTGSVCGPTVGTAAGIGVDTTVNGSDASTVIPFGPSAPVGAYLTFHVQGVGPQNLVGDSTGDNACTEGWAPPNAAEFTLNATTAPGQANATSAIEQLQVVPQGVSAAAAFGSDMTEFSFTVSGPGLSSPWQSGQQTSATAIVDGLSPNAQYTATVTVSPSGHPNAAATASTTFSPASIPWPAGMDISAPQATIDASNPDVASVSAILQNAFADGPPNLGLEASVVVACGNSQLQETGLAVTPQGSEGQITIPNFDAVDYGGNCTMQLVLVQETSTNVHGGPYNAPADSPAVPFVLGATSLPALSSSDFAATFNPNPPTPQSGQSDPYAGSTVITSPNASGFPIAPNAGDWSESFTGELSGGSACSSPTSGATPPSGWSGGSLAPIDVSACLDSAAASMTADTGSYGGSVTVTYVYLGMEETATVPIASVSLQATSAPTISTMVPFGSGSTPFVNGEEIEVTGYHLSTVDQPLAVTPSDGSGTIPIPECSPPTPGPMPTPNSCWSPSTDSSGNPDILFFMPDLNSDSTSGTLVVTNPYGSSAAFTFPYTGP